MRLYTVHMIVYLKLPMIIHFVIHSNGSVNHIRQPAGQFTVSCLWAGSHYIDYKIYRQLFTLSRHCILYYVIVLKVTYQDSLVSSHYSVIPKLSSFSLAAHLPSICFFDVAAKMIDVVTNSAHSLCPWGKHRTNKLLEHLIGGRGK